MKRPPQANWKPRGWPLALLAAWLGGWLPSPAQVQAQAQATVPVGQGLRGDYYRGLNFERLVLSRREGPLDFDWQHEPPGVGLPAEDFSVRWTGWLRPPATGRYRLRLTVDDGARLWVGGRLLVDEWRGQALSFYEVSVELRAGQAVALRLDYCQFSYDSRLLLAWTRPDQAPPAASWRNLWGAAASAEPMAIPARYLFGDNPTAPAAPVRVAADAAAPEPSTPAPARQVAARPAPQPTTRLARPLPVARPIRRAVGPAQTTPVVTLPALPALPSLPARPAPLVRLVAPAPGSAVLSPAATDARAGAAARLAGGQAVVLRALYFEQGRAGLLPAARAALDTLAAALAAALAARPALRLEVQGHTDNQGDSTLNRRLSAARAEAVRRYLAAHGVAAARLRAVGYGGTHPVADNEQPAARARNRRVVLRPLPE